MSKKKKPSAKVSQALRENKLKETWLLERIHSESRDMMKEWADKEVTRELACWIMSMRTRFDALSADIEAIWEATKEGGALHGLISHERLHNIFFALHAADSDVTMLTVDVHTYGPLKIRANWDESASRSPRLPSPPGPDSSPHKSG